jgi:hypothetical protein
LQTLRQLKREAIDALDFDRSDAIQQIINGLDTDASGTIIAKYKDWLTTGIGEALDTLDANVGELSQAAFDRELQYRADVDSILAATRERHIDEMAALALAEGVAQLKEEQRDPADIRAMRTAAKRLAASDLVGHANALKDEAARAADDGLRARSEAVAAGFRLRAEHAGRRQAAELEAMQAEFAAGITEIDRAVEEGERAQNKKAVVYIKGQLRRAVAEATEHVTRPNQRAKIAAELAAAVASCLRERQREALLEEKKADRYEKSSFTQPVAAVG